MKIAILGDTHFLVRNGSRSFNNYFKNFYTNIFFPYLLDNNIKTVVQLGDIFDNRKVTHIQGLSECKKYFFDKFDEYNIDLNIIIGNHDSFFKDTILTNSPQLILGGKYNNIKIFETPQEIEFISGCKSLMLPWICKENYNEFDTILNNTRTDICFGHLELKDFAMYKGVISDDGMDANIFNKFEFVFTGHYHHRSNKQNIYYLGTPYELTWQDESDIKGFHIFDYETRELTFVKNPYKMFNKIYYDDILHSDEIKKNIENNVFFNFTETYIKVVVKSKENPYLFDLFIDSLYKISPLELIIVDDMVDVLGEEINDVDESEDTPTILSKYIDGTKPKELDSNRLKLIINELYNEAISLETI